MKACGKIERQPAWDGKIWCIYNIVSTEAASTLLYSTTGITVIEIDGVSVPVAKTYLFSSTGEHLIKFTLSSSTTGIAQNQFYQVIRLKEIVTPSSITAIGQRAFYGCTGLTTINLPNVRTIAYQCFYGCTSLTGELNLPSLTAFSGAASTGGEFYNTRFNSISSLGSLKATRNQTFGANTSLVTAVLPETLTALTQWTFYNDTALKYVTCRAVAPPSFDRAFQGCSSLLAIYVPAESVEDYKAASGWSAYASIISAI